MPYLIGVHASLAEVSGSRNWTVGGGVPRRGGPLPSASPGTLLCLGSSSSECPYPRATQLQRVREKGLEDVVMMNVDSNTLETPFDDVQALPPDVVSVNPFHPPAASGRRGCTVACSVLPPCPPGVPAEAEAKEGRTGPRGRSVPSLPQSPGPALRGLPRCTCLQPGEQPGCGGRGPVGP